MSLIKITGILTKINNCHGMLVVQMDKFMHTSSKLEAWGKYNEPTHWPSYNDKIYPPQTADEERRPAVSHSWNFILKNNLNK